VTDKAQFGELMVEAALARFMAEEALPGTGVTPAAFWAGSSAVLADLAPANAALLAERDALQAKIDAWHRAHPARPIDTAAYTAFLRAIGYLLPEGPDFSIATSGGAARVRIVLPNDVMKTLGEVMKQAEENEEGGDPMEAGDKQKTGAPKF
jgi:malate synthase